MSGPRAPPDAHCACILNAVLNWESDAFIWYDFSSSIFLFSNLFLFFCFLFQLIAISLFYSNETLSKTPTATFSPIVPSFSASQSYRSIAINRFNHFTSKEAPRQLFEISYNLPLHSMYFFVLCAASLTYSSANLSHARIYRLQFQQGLFFVISSYIQVFLH